MKLTKEHSEEITKCAEDFSYFCKNYVKIYDWKNKEVSFKLYPYQERLYDHVESNDFSIFSKFRQGGFTTELAIYGLWKCLFGLDQSVLFFCKTEREAADICNYIVKRAITHLPEWLVGNVMKMTSSYEKSFPDTNSKIAFMTPHAACGRSSSLLIIDEASLIKDIRRDWASIWPGISTGKCIISSTANYYNDWFWEMLEDALFGLNKFKVFINSYKEHPEYCKPEWEAEMKNNVGLNGWRTGYEQKPIDQSTVNQPEIVVKKGSKKQWRSIWDEWEPNSSGLDQGSSN